MKTECFIPLLFVLLVGGVFGETDEVSGIKGHNITLQTGLAKQNYLVIRWYFNDIQIALFDRELGEGCLYDGEGGIFRDRLEVNYETGSLTITNISPEHDGQYEAEIIQKTSRRIKISIKCNSTKITKKPKDLPYSKTFTLTISESDEKMESVKTGSDSGLSAQAVAGIVAVVLLVSVAVVGGVIYSQNRKSRKDGDGQNSRDLRESQHSHEITDK